MFSKLIIVVTLISAFTFVWCGDFYTVNGKSYYSSYPQKNTAFDSYEFCVYHGMHLIEVMTQLENNVVLSLIRAVNTNHNVTASSFWTSGTDLSSEDGWWWANNGYAAIYTNWGDRQPDNTYEPEFKTTENCLVYSAPNYKWDDVPCLSKHYFLCRDSYDVPVYPTRTCPKEL